MGVDVVAIYHFVFLIVKRKAVGGKDKRQKRQNKTYDFLFLAT